jgi:ribosomal 50S subunit-recycling heat shock protein
MRIDKFLKVSRILKRRVVANEACDAGRVAINGKVAKAGSEVKVGDLVEINFAGGNTKIEVLAINDSTKKADAVEMYRIIQ